MEKGVFQGKNDMYSIKRWAKMWITFWEKEKQYRSGQSDVDKFYVNTRAEKMDEKRKTDKKQLLLNNCKL